MHVIYIMRITDIAIRYTVGCILRHDIAHLTGVHLLYYTHNRRTVQVYLVKQTEPLRQV